MSTNARIGTGTSRAVFLYLALSLISSVYLYLFLRILWRVGDEGLVVYGAQRVAEGALPYRDFVEVFGPASFYWLALFFSLFGTKWLVARGLLLFTGTASVILIYWMTRRVYRGPLEMFPAFVYLVLGIPLWPASNHHWDSNFFALLAVGTFLLWRENRNGFSLVLSGVFAGITSCFLQQKGVLLLSSFLLLIFLDEKRRPYGARSVLKRTGALTTGYGGWIGIVLVFFYLEGSLPDLVYSTFLWPMANYHNVNIAPYGYGLFEFYWPAWLSFFRQFFPEAVSLGMSSVFLVPFAFLLSLPFLVAGLALVSYRPFPNRPVHARSTTTTCLCCGFALWISEAHRMDLFHMVYGAPLLLVAFLGIWSHGSEKTEPFRRYALYLLSLALLAFGTFNGLFASTADTRIETRRGTLYGFREDPALMYLLEHTRPEEQVFVYPYYPMYYFLANVHNPTRYNNLIYGYHTEEQFREVITDLEKTKVRLVLWDTVVGGKNLKTWFPQYEHPREEQLELEHYFQAHYDVIGMENGFRILRRRGRKKSLAPAGHLAEP